MPPQPLLISKAQASYVPLHAASQQLLTPRTPHSFASNSKPDRPLLQSPFAAVLTTEEWEEEGEDGKLLPVEVVVPSEEDEKNEKQKRRAGRWALYGLGLLGFLGALGWGVSIVFGGGEGVM